jgi:hypothetical protein
VAMRKPVPAGVFVPAGADQTRCSTALGLLWDAERAYAELSAVADREGRRALPRPEVAAARLESVIEEAQRSWSRP